MPASVPATARHPGVIYTIAPSYLKENILWVGSDDGLIHVTFNGGRTWKDVTPPALRARPWSKISIMDASHFDTLTAYAAVNTLRLDDMRPHLFRTRDGGKTWTEIVAGIDSGAITSVIREDPKARGLLYAGSEHARMGVVRRRRPLAVAAPQHAGDVDSRPGHQGRRRRGRDARAIVLDSG